MEFDKINTDEITVQDCIDMYKMKNKYCVINDGKVVKFESEDCEWSY